MKIYWAEILISNIIHFLALLLLSTALFRPVVKWIVGKTIKRLMSDTYNENLWEIVVANKRVSPSVVIENSLRAHTGEILTRPLGSPRKFLNFDGLIFSPAQLFRLPTFTNEPVDMKTIIGPKAKKPLEIAIPILAGGMGYAVAVSGKVKRIIAKATSQVGTAANTGHGAFLPEERELAKYLIIQYTPGHWAKSPEILQQADAIEIHLGQGAFGSSSKPIPPEKLQGEIRDTFKLAANETLVIPARFEEINEPNDLKILVDKLRATTDGVPIGVKMCGSGEIEEDIKIAVDAGVDFISIDGGQAGSESAPPIFQDDFGLPTIYALSRAASCLKQLGVKDQVSLLIGGGVMTPGETLKAIALGADAVFMGTALLWAMAHDQVTKAIPWEPPTHLAFYSGKMKDELNEEESVVYLQRFLHSCTEEMKEAIRSLGKRSIREVNSEEDLVALDEWTSKVTGVKLAYKQ